MSAKGLVLLAMNWRDDSPFIRLRCSDASHSDLVPAAGLALNYRLGKHVERACLGHVPFRKGRNEYHDCSTPLQASSRRCERCTIVEATFASNLHHAHTRGRSEIDPAIREHLAQPNQLYLAAFRDGSIKIGTSTLTRVQTRLAEQGAWIARFAAIADDGFAVRDLEDRVTAELGLPQAVGVGRKISGLISPVDDAELNERLDRHLKDVVALIDTMNDRRIEASDRRWRSPVAEDPVLDNMLRYPLKLRSGSHDLEIVGAIGRVCAARRPGTTDVFAIDPGELFGIKIETGNFASDEIAIQDSLF